MAQFVYTMHRVGKVVPPKRHILKNISLSFFPGAKIGVLGLNGAGKSTLLRIMAGIDKDIEGDYFANGIPNNLSNSLASSSVFAVVTKTISIPLILSTLSYSISGKISCSLIPIV